MKIPTEAELIEMERSADWFAGQVQDLKNKSDSAYEHGDYRNSRSLEVHGATLRPDQ